MDILEMRDCMKVKIILADVLEKRGMSRYELSKRTGIKFQTIDNYYKNRVYRYDAYNLAKICEALDCGIADILECVRDEEA